MYKKLQMMSMFYPVQVASYLVLLQCSGQLTKDTTPAMKCTVCEDQWSPLLTRAISILTGWEHRTCAASTGLPCHVKALNVIVVKWPLYLIGGLNSQL